MEKHPFERFSGPEKVEFGATECCALAHAFSRNKETLSELMKIVDAHTLRVAADILLRTSSISFQKNSDVDLAYFQMAKAELERLQGNEAPKFRCKHSKEEHEEALRTVMNKVQETMN